MQNVIDQVNQDQAYLVVGSFSFTLAACLLPQVHKHKYDRQALSVQKAGGPLNSAFCPRLRNAFPMRHLHNTV